MSPFLCHWNPPSRTQAVEYVKSLLGLSRLLALLLEIQYCHLHGHIHYICISSLKLTWGASRSTLDAFNPVACLCKSFSFSWVLGTPLGLALLSFTTIHCGLSANSILSLNAPLEHSAFRFSLAPTNSPSAQANSPRSPTSGFLCPSFLPSHLYLIPYSPYPPGKSQTSSQD